MSAGRGHVGTEIKHETPLWWALGLTSTFLVAEVIGGLLTNALVDYTAIGAGLVMIAVIVSLDFLVNFLSYHVPFIGRLMSSPGRVGGAR